MYRPKPWQKRVHLSVSFVVYYEPLTFLIILLQALFCGNSRVRITVIRWRFPLDRSDDMERRPRIKYSTHGLTVALFQAS
jgi:hypothetical protein